MKRTIEEMRAELAKAEQAQTKLANIGGEDGWREVGIAMGWIRPRKAAKKGPGRARKEKAAAPAVLE